LASFNYKAEAPLLYLCSSARAEEMGACMWPRDEHCVESKGGLNNKMPCLSETPNFPLQIPS